MSIENLIPNILQIDVLGQKRDVNFTLRNYAAIKRVLGISEQTLLNGLGEGDIEMIIAAIWGSTLIFDDFDIKNPLKIKDQLNILDLYNMDMKELLTISKTLGDALVSALPEPEPTIIKKNVEKISHQIQQ